MCCKLLLLTMVVSGGGCVGSQDSESGRVGPGLDRAALIAELKQSGHAVETKGPIVQPFLSMPGQLLNIDGTDVQTFEYDSAKSIQIEVAKISPNGSTVGETRIGWVEPPHFYSKGTLLVLYVGINQQTLTVLESVLGPQIAGE